MSAKYLFLHKNRRLAVFSTDFISILDIRVTPNKEDQRYLPPGVISIESLKSWIMNRGIPITRDGIKKDIRVTGAKSPFSLMLYNYGLSLTDAYWLRPVSESSLTWERVSPHINRFKSSAVLSLHDFGTINRTEFNPSASLKGDLKKKWVIGDDNIRYLIKGNYEDTHSQSCRQSICEVFATLLHEKQGYTGSHVPYSFVKIPYKGREVLGCKCPCMTSEDIEFFSAYDLIGNLNKRNDQSWYDFYIQFCERNLGLSIRANLEYQIMTDFIISNSDRHLNNFGVLRNNTTLNWIGMSPIFDSGNSLFYKLDYIPVGRALLEMAVTSFLSKEIQLLKYITNRSLVHIDRLPTGDELYNLLKVDTRCTDEINQRIVRAYLKKVQIFRDFQNGANVWGYPYIKSFK